MLPAMRSLTRFALAALVASVLFLLPAHHAAAAVETWTGATSGLWSVGTNWSSGVAPASGDSLDFPSSGVTNKSTTDDLGPLSLSGIQIDDGGFALNESGGSTITLTGNVLDTAAVSTISAINVALIINTATFDVHFSNAIANLDIVTPVSEMGGSRSMLVDGAAGLLILDGANTFSGGLTASNGARLTPGVNSALGSGAVTVNLGSDIEVYTGLTIANPLTISGTGVGSGAIVTDVAGSTIFSGTIALGADASVNNANTGGGTSLSGVVSGAHKLSLDDAGGAGFLGISGANTYSGGTDDHSGGVRANGAASLGSGAVTAEGTLLLDGGATWSNALTLNNSGHLFSATGSNTWSGTVATAGGGVSYFETVIGAPLTVTGALSGPNQINFLDNGGGAKLTLAGAAANTNTGPLFVQGGTLVLNKPAGTAAMNGDLDVGDLIHASDAQFSADNQLGTLTNLFVYDPATVHLNGHTETVHQNTAMYGGQIITDGGGTLVIVGGLSGGGVATTASVGTVTPGGGTLNLTTGTHFFTVARGTAARDMIIHALITGSGGFGLNSNGILELDADNTYSGATILSNGGTLLVEGNQPSSTIDVGGGAGSPATLGGSGTVGNVVASNGTLSPGNSPGILNMNALTMDSLSTFVAELNGTTVGTQYDQLSTSGAVSLGNAALNVSFGYAPMVGNSFTILRNKVGGAIVGTFNGLPEGAQFAAGGHILSISYVGGAGHDVVLTVIAGFPTSTSLTSSPNPSTAGQTVTLTATVTSTSGGTPTGTVTFFDGGTSLGSAALNGSGVASFTTSGLGAGTHNLTAQYGGDGTHAASTSAVLAQTVNAVLPQTVNAAPSVPPTGVGSALLALMLVALGLALVVGGARRRRRGVSI